MEDNEEIEFNTQGLGESVREYRIMHEWVGRVVIHFKGDMYLILCIAKHTETDEDMVVYKALYENCKVYTRPLKMFAEKCAKEQFEKYGREYRFTLANIESANKG